MAKLSALGSAVRKTPGAGKKPPANIVVASDIVEPSLNLNLKQAEIIAAIEGFAEGKKMYDEGDSMMKTHRPVLTAAATFTYARQWVQQGSQPETPKLTTKGDGSGVFISSIFFDKEVNIADPEIATLANVIGAGPAEASVSKYDQISFNDEKANVKVQITEKGKKVEKTLIEIVDAAITEAFTKYGIQDQLPGLFEVKEVSKTKKGLLPQGLTLVGGPQPGAIPKLVSFLQAAKIVLGFKPGSSGND